VALCFIGGGNCTGIRLYLGHHLIMSGNQIPILVGDMH
jgi:hypothetical protein